MSYFKDLLNAFLGKSYAQLDNKPKEENRGATWQSVMGVEPTYSQGKSLLAYGLHGYTHAGVKRASQDLSALNLKLIKGYGDKAIEIMEHPVLDLMRQPNSYTDEFLFREQITTDLILCGNCYILLLGAVDKRPLSLVRLHPNEVKIATEQDKGLIGYEHNSSGKIVMYPPNRIIHGRTASYSEGASSLYGTGAIEALSREIDADLNAQSLASQSSQKGRPDVLLSPKEEGDIWPKEMRRQILDQYMGLAKQGGALVLSGQVDVKELQLSPRDMEFQASRTFARESISAVLGVPPSVLGLPTANYALGRQQAIEYWSNQVKRGKRIGQLFTRIAKLWDDSLHFEHDYSDVEALQSIRDSQLDRIQKHIQNGVPPEVAYVYEGLNYPKKVEPVDYGHEEQENVRGLEVLAKLYSLDIPKEENKIDLKGKIAKKTDISKKMFTCYFDDNIMISSTPSNPKQQSEEDILKSILQDQNWNDYKLAHLLIEPNQEQLTSGYLIRIGRRLDPEEPNNSSPEKGDIMIFQDLLSRAVDYLNGRYGRLPITEEQRRKAYVTIQKYFIKLDSEAPALLDNYLSLNITDNDIYDIFEPVKKKEEVRYKKFTDIDFTEKIRKEYSKLWCEGGSVRGDEIYKKLINLSKVYNTKNLTTTDKRVLDSRELWIERNKNTCKDLSKKSVSQIEIKDIGHLIQHLRYLSTPLGLQKTRSIIAHLMNSIDDEKKRERDRVKLWKSYIKSTHRKIEKEFENKFYGYLQGAKKRYVQRIKKAKVGKSTEYVIDLASLLATQIEDNELDKAVGSAFLELFNETGNKEIDNVFNMSSKDKPTDLKYSNSALAKETWDTSRQEITRSTSNAIRSVVEKGLSNGESVNDIATNLMSQDKSGLFTTSRAKRIARTETTKLVNESTVDSYRLVQQEGINIEKEWLSARDNKVRDSHKELDGVSVPIESYFVTSGGNKALQPAGFEEPSENINCRCIIIPNILDDDDF